MSFSIRGVSLSVLNSCLNNCILFVGIINYLLSFQNIKCGVPQGSVSDPHLFNIYRNDIVDIGNQANFIIYVDDTTLHFFADCVSRIITRPNIVLRKFYSWSKNNCHNIPYLLESKTNLFTEIVTGISNCVLD